MAPTSLLERQTHWRAPAAASGIEAHGQMLAWHNSSQSAIHLLGSLPDSADKFLPWLGHNVSIYGRTSSGQEMSGHWWRGRVGCIPAYAPGKGNKTITQPNVLYAVAHDLRADLNSPVLERLGSDPFSVTFQMAFTQAPMCSPSRHSFFTGRHPARSRSFTFADPWIMTEAGLDADGRTLAWAESISPQAYNALNPVECRARAAAIFPTGNTSSSPLATSLNGTVTRDAESLSWVSLPQAFADAGYETVGAGITLTENNNLQECATCWNAGYYALHIDSHDRYKMEGHVDLEIARAIQQWLRQRAERRSPSAPFFAMAGFWGGHSPYGPSKSRDLAREALKAYGDGWRVPPQGGTDPAYPFFDRQLSLDAVAHARAGLSQRLRVWDNAFGNLLSTLQDVGRWNDTIVLFHADHGLSLGEFGFLRNKGKLLDVDTRVPFVLRAPPLATKFDGSLPRGGTSQRIISLLDVFPTLCELASISASCPRTAEQSLSLHGLSQYQPEQPPLDGRSLVDEFRSTRKTTSPSEFTTSVYARCPQDGDHEHIYCLKVGRHEVRIMGTSVRSRRWRYTVWAPYQPQAYAPLLAKDPMLHVRNGQVELYSYTDDNYAALRPKRFLSSDLAVERVNLMTTTNHSLLTKGTLAVLESLHCRATAVWYQGVACPQLVMGEAGPK